MVLPVNNTQNALYSVRFDIGTQHDVQEDFSLPDYMPEVRQIVSSRAAVLPENVFIDQNELVLSGLVMYTILYVGDDGKLTCATLNSEYTAKLNTGVCEVTGVFAESIPYVTQITSCTCRATGPRRLSLSARMTTKAISAVQRKHTEIITDKADGGKTRYGAEDLFLERHVLEVGSADVTRHSITGTVTGSFSEKKESKIVSCHCTAGVTDIRQDDRSVKVSGSIYLNCLFMGADGKYYSIKEHCPFEDTISSGIPMQKNSGDASAVVRCAGLNVNGDDSGEYKWELEYDVDVIRDTPYISSLTDDIYSTAFVTSCEMEDIPRFVCLKNGNSRLSLNASRVINGGGEKTVCHTVCKAVTDRVEYTCDGKLTVNGSCTVQSIVESDGVLRTEDVTIPMKFECMGKSSDGVCHAVCSVDVMNVQSKLDGDKLTVDAELCISYVAYAVSKTKCISSCAVDVKAPIEKKRACVTVYFPEENETLWDIGKKYHCRSEKIEVLGKNMPVIINA